jgi:hypothetical protein
VKRIFLVVLMVAFFASAQGQRANADDISLYATYASASPVSGSLQTKRYDVLNIQKGFNPPGARMKRLGTTFTVIGGMLIVGGILVSSSASNDSGGYYSNGVYYQDNTNQVLGVVMIIYGVGFTIPGAILWSKGAKKMRWYEQQQELTLNIKGAGLGLAYKF